MNSTAMHTISVASLILSFPEKLPFIRFSNSQRNKSL